MVDIAVKDGLKEYEATDGKSWEDELERDERLKQPETDDVVKEEERDEEYESSVETVKACKRPWWVVQPYVRPLPREALAKGSLTLSKKERERIAKEEKSRKETGVTNGHTETGVVGSGTEIVELPKEGLVCG